MDSFINAFHIDWKIIIAQVVNFGVIFLVLYLFALKPLKKIMQERTRKIEQGLKDAHDNALLIAQSKDEYESMLKKAKAEAHELFQEGKREAEAKKAEMIANAQKDVENMIVNGKKILESEKAKMIEEAKREVVSLVVSATEKVLTDQKDKSINDGVLKKISKM